MLSAAEQLRDFQHVQARHPAAFATARPTLRRFLARTEPSPAVAASALDVLAQLPAKPAEASTPLDR